VYASDDVLFPHIVCLMVWLFFFPPKPVLSLSPRPLISASSSVVPLLHFQPFSHRDAHFAYVVVSVAYLSTPTTYVGWLETSVFLVLGLFSF